MVRSIEWHKRMAESWERNLQRIADEIDIKRIQLDQEQTRLKAYQAIIARVIKKGKTEFDIEHYGKKRKGAVAP